MLLHKDLNASTVLVFQRFFELKFTFIFLLIKYFKLCARNKFVDFKGNFALNIANCKNYKFGGFKNTCDDCRSAGQSSYSSSSSSQPMGPVGKTISWIVVIAIAIGICLFIHSRTDFFRNIGDNIAGWFGNETAAQAAEMNRVRKADWTDIDIPADELEERKAAIDEFIASDGVSYRMKGEVQFGRDRGNFMFESFTMRVELSYNAELDVYKFIFKDKGNSGNHIYNDERFSRFHIPGGTYYIINEDGKSYVLSDVDGTKKVSEENSSLYRSLMLYRLENLIITDFILDDPGDYAEGSYRNNVLRKQGAFFYRSKSGSGDGVNFLPFQLRLRTYNAMPVSYLLINNIGGTDIGSRIEFDIFYNRIPDDNPSVADWK